MNGELYPALRQCSYSDEPDVDQWAHKYLDDKAEYYDELYRRVTRLASRDSKILEIGSAPCQFTYLLDSSGYDVTGIDLDPSRFAPFIEAHDLDVRECDIEHDELPVASGSVDLVLMTEVLEHLRIDPLNTLREIRRVLSSDGYLYLTTPNQYRLPAIWNYLHGEGAISHAHNEFAKLERVGHMGHVREYAPADLRELLEEEGFTVEAHEFSSFGNRPARDRPVLGRLAERMQSAIPWTRRVQIVIAKPR